MIKHSTILALAGLIEFGANAEAPPAPPTVAYEAPAMTNCSEQKIIIYFPAGKSTLTQQAEDVLQAANSKLDGCIIGEIDYSVISDDQVSETRRTQLSEDRVEAVQSALSDQDLSPLRTAETTSFIEAGVTKAPLARRVELRVTAWAPEIS